MAIGIYVGVDGVAKKVKKCYVGVKMFDVVALPEGYTQLAYIESDGTQYIDTGFLPNQDTRVVSEFELTSLWTSAMFVYGSRNTDSGSAPIQFGLAIPSSSSLRADYFGANATHSVSSIYDRFIVDQNKNISYVGELSKESPIATGQCDYSLYLFCVNNIGSVLRPFVGRIYSVKIYDDEDIVRDYIPCTAQSGKVGLYDLVGKRFYRSKGTEDFIAGPSIPSAAMKILKAYIGIGDVARPVFSTEVIQYYGEATPLSSGRYYIGAASVGNYALFGGGISRSSAVTAYDASLVQTDATSLGDSSNYITAVSTKKYALFAGGYGRRKTMSGRYSSINSSAVDAYDVNLTKTNPGALSTARGGMGAAVAGEYALFCGGLSMSKSGDITTYALVDAYDQSLVKSTPDAITTSGDKPSGVSVGDFAVIVGGSAANAYNRKLTKVSAPMPVASTSDQVAATATVGAYGLVASGSSGMISAYSKSLTVIEPDALNVSRQHLAAATLRSAAIFAGGTAAACADIYNKYLVRTTEEFVFPSREYISATTVGDFALFAGGYSSCDNVYAYTY